MAVAAANGGSECNPQDSMFVSNSLFVSWAFKSHATSKHVLPRQDMHYEKKQLECCELDRVEGYTIV